jgi:hypothetical protein
VEPFERAKRMLAACKQKASPMQTSRYATNLYINGDAYVKQIFGLDLPFQPQAERNKDNYETWVVRFLDVLWTRFTSSRVIMAIGRKTPRTVAITPRDHSPDPTSYFDRFKPEIDRMCNAQAKPTNPQAAILAGRPWTLEGKDYPTATTTGTGSDVVVPFMPWIFKSICGTGIPINRADCVLLHELTHALSCLNGKSALMDGAPRAFDNLEEFTAIVVTNVYLSETGSQQLVGGHHGEVLPAALNDGQAFYNEYKEPLQKVCQNHQKLVGELRLGKNIAHNPFLFCQV